MPSRAAPGRLQPAARGTTSASSKFISSTKKGDVDSSTAAVADKATSSSKATPKQIATATKTAAKPANAAPAAASKQAAPAPPSTAPTTAGKTAQPPVTTTPPMQHIAAGNLTEALKAYQDNMQADMNEVVDEGPCAGLTPLLMIVPGTSKANPNSPGASALISLLLSRGASTDVQAPGSGDTPVMWAVANQQQELALQLIAKAKQLQVKNAAGLSALDVAMSSGQDTVAAAVIAAMGTGVAQQDAAAFLCTAMGRKSDCVVAELVKLLKSAELEAVGVTFKSLATQGMGAAALAHWCRFSSMQGNKPVDSEGNTALHMLAECGAPYDLIMGLIKLGLQPNAINEAANTPLHVAALAGHVEVCHALVDGGADVLKRNGKNRRPREVPKCPECTKAYLLEAEEAAKSCKANKQSELWDEKIKATQTESAFGLRCL